MKRVACVTLGLVLMCTGCDKLASLKGTRTQIKGDWHRIEMSFPSDETWNFAEGMIRVDGLERGTYIFRGHSRIEVVFDGMKTLYRLSFPEDKTMVWYRTMDNGSEERAAEFKRVES